jgi:hypothetical protein
MFKLKNEQVVDSTNRVVGIVVDGKFRQSNLTHQSYKDGLTPLELEQISEVIQSARIIGTRKRS